MRLRPFVLATARVLFRGDEGRALNVLRYLQEGGVIPSGGKNRFGRNASAEDAAALLIAAAHDGRTADVADWVNLVGGAECHASHRYAGAVNAELQIDNQATTFGRVAVIDEFGAVNLKGFVEHTIRSASDVKASLPSLGCFSVTITQQFPSGEFIIRVPATEAAASVDWFRDSVTMRFLLDEVKPAVDSAFRQDRVVFRDNCFLALQRALAFDGDGERE